MHCYDTPTSKAEIPTPEAANLSTPATKQAMTAFQETLEGFATQDMVPLLRPRCKPPPHEAVQDLVSAAINSGPAAFVAQISKLFTLLVHNRPRPERCIAIPASMSPATLLFRNASKRLAPSAATL